VPGRFQDDTVWVHDDVVVDGHRIVRSASGDGFWRIPDDPIRYGGGTIPVAVFEPHPSATFVCHVR
jgi:hypothetical protein